MKKATGPFYKDGFFYRRSDPPWAIRLYRENTWDKGDLLSNTLKEIVDTEDCSEWAHDSLAACFALMVEGKRWPDRMNQGIDCGGFICFYWQKFKFQILKWAERLYRSADSADSWKYKTGRKIAYSIHCKFGPQANPTRDPWTYGMVAAHMMDSPVFFVFRPQRRLWRPGFWSWMDYLESGGDVKYKMRYYFWRLFSCSKKDYVLRQQGYRERLI